MLELAVAYEQVGVRRREVATARATAATVIADADATTLMLAIKKDAATGQSEQREQRRKDAGMMQRRAQAHRLRMQLRAAKLRASAAEEAAEERRRVRARQKECWLRGRWLPVCARRDSPQACFPGSRSAWTPLIRKRLHSAATSNTAGISLPACSLTAVTRWRGAFAAADRERERADTDLNAAEQAWQGAVAEQATATEKERKGREEEAQSEPVPLRRPEVRASS